MWFRRRDPEFENRVIRGVPDVFTQKDTTYGTARRMAEEVRDYSAQTSTEQGLAITLLAVIDDLEHVLRNNDKKGEPRGDDHGQQGGAHRDAAT